MDEDDPMDDEWEMTRTQQGHDVDLFDDGEEPQSSTNGNHRPKGDNTDTSCGPGMSGPFLVCSFLKNTDG